MFEKVKTETVSSGPHKDVNTSVCVVSFTQKPLQQGDSKHSDNSVGLIQTFTHEYIHCLAQTVLSPL